MYGLSTPRANTTTFVLWGCLEVILSWNKSMRGCRWYGLLSRTEGCVSLWVLINVWALIWDCFMAVFESWRQLIIVSTLRFSARKSSRPILEIGLIAIHAGLPDFFQLFLRWLFLFLHLTYSSSYIIAYLSRWYCSGNCSPVEVLTAYCIIILNLRSIGHRRHSVLIPLPLSQKLGGTAQYWCSVF